MSSRRAGRVDDGRVPHRGWAATAGLLLIALGAWGALIPFLGPYFDFAFTPDEPWQWTAARGWLSVLPGAVTVVAGIVLVGDDRRGGAALGGWLAVAAGTWLTIGPVLADPLGIGAIGTPTADSAGMRALEQLTYHELLGVVIVFLAAATLGRHGGTRTMITEAPSAERPPREHPAATAPAEPHPGRRAVVIDERDESLADTGGRHVADEPVPARSSPVHGPITADQAYRTGGQMSGRSDR